MARPAAAKTCRIDLRATREQKAFIKRVARAQGQKISDFVLNSAREKAEMILADQKEFLLSPKQWASFVVGFGSTGQPSRTPGSSDVGTVSP